MNTHDHPGTEGRDTEWKRMDSIITAMKRRHFRKLESGDADEWSKNISVKLSKLRDQLELARNEQERKSRLEFSEPFKAWPIYRIAVEADILMDEIRMFQDALDEDGLYFIGVETLNLLCLQTLLASASRDF